MNPRLKFELVALEPALSRFGWQSKKGGIFDLE
jgi:hypothetical protein